MRKKIKIVLVLIIFLTIAFVAGKYLLFSGRTASRYLGKGSRQVLTVEHMKQFISISFYSDELSTIKDVTFLATDGNFYTQEFKDISPLEGTIRWVPYGNGDDFIQSRKLSRWLNSAINLELPEDCEKILGVDISSISGDERVKNLTYLSADGKILSKEYREGWIDRKFEGWLEIKPIQ